MPCSDPDVQPAAQYAVVTGAYWAFTLSDGALRMLVLLHLHAVGRSPLELLWALLPYELAGVVTNLLGGFLGARLGVRATLVAGLVLQFCCCLALAAVGTQPALVLVMASQLVSGVAKDLAKTGAKTSVKALAPTGDHGALFRLVALLTGSKNALKGLGFFLGGALLAVLDFRSALACLAAVLALAALLAATCLPAALGRSRQAPRMASLFAHDGWLNALAAARLLLFGSRDVWFAIALPLFLVADAGWSAAGVSAFLAAWVIGYGIVQALAPGHVRPVDVAAGGRAVAGWTLAAALPLVVAAVLLAQGAAAGPVLVVTLLAYGFVFATGSSLHSWLVVARGGEDTALRVGFYYAANAAGRVVGLAASAVLYTAFGQGSTGMVACLVGAAVAAVLAALCSLPLRRS